MLHQVHIKEHEIYSSSFVTIHLLSGEIYYIESSFFSIGTTDLQYRGFLKNCYRLYELLACFTTLLHSSHTSAKKVFKTVLNSNKK